MKTQIIEFRKITELYDPHFDSYTLRNDGTFCNPYRGMLGFTLNEMLDKVKSMEFYIYKLKFGSEEFINTKEYYIVNEPIINKVVKCKNNER